jgi:hypothetical protein
MKRISLSQILKSDKRVPYGMTNTKTSYREGRNMKSQVHDQMPESLRRTLEIERQKEHQRIQKPEDPSKTDRIEEEKKKHREK